MISFKQAISRTPLRCSRMALIAVALLHAASALADSASEARIGIDELEVPAPAQPPALDSTKQLDDDVRRMRGRRRRRDKQDTQAAPTVIDKLSTALDNEAKTPHPKTFFLELAFVGGGISTLGSRQGYTSEPSIHFNAAYRFPKANSTPGVAAPPPDHTPDFWLGVRVAPFYGRGFYQGRPGAYGLTYFGPMIAVGKIDPPASSGGNTEAAKADEATAKAGRPVASGWLLSGGIAGVSKQGHSSVPEKVSSDFATKGVAFDVPGLWVEIRNMYVVLGAVGVDIMAGVQTGQEKAFFYAGVGLSGWD